MIYIRYVFIFLLATSWTFVAFNLLSVHNQEKSFIEKTIVLLQEGNHKKNITLSDKQKFFTGAGWIYKARRVNKEEYMLLKELEMHLVYHLGHTKCNYELANVLIGHAEPEKARDLHKKVIGQYVGFGAHVKTIVFFDNPSIFNAFTNSFQTYQRTRVFLHESLHLFQECSDVPKNEDRHHPDYFAPILWEDSENSVLSKVYDKVVGRYPLEFFAKIGSF